MKIGTRGSELALAQARLVSGALSRIGYEVQEVVITTAGDRRQGRAEDNFASSSSSSKVQDKKEWIRELEQALLSGEIDVAVHSGKDVPLDIEGGTVLTSVLVRESASDVFVGKRQKSCGRLRMGDLQSGAIVGTSSRRRKAQLLAFNAGLAVEEFRGNVTTRLRTLDESERLSGIVLARAGIMRLGRIDAFIQEMPIEHFVPAVNQGILVSQYLGDRPEIVEALDRVSDANTQLCWMAERACIKELGADCFSAVGVYAQFQFGVLSLRAQVLSELGEQKIEVNVERELSPTDFEQSISLGESAGHILLERGAGGLLQ